MKKFLKYHAIIACLLALALVFAGCEAPPVETEESSSVITTVESVETSAETTETVETTETTDTESSEQTSAEIDKSPEAIFNPENLSTSPIDLSSIPAYTDKPYTEVNGNLPFFTEAEITAIAYENYAALDSLGRCGTALACCGKETMPAANEERGNISSITPTGWVQAKYICVSGQSLYNRCHLIAWQLSAEKCKREKSYLGNEIPQRRRNDPV